MKRMMTLFGMMLASCAAMADTEIVDGIEWTYTVDGGTASVGGGDLESPAVPTSTTCAITVPSTLGGCPVTSIGDWAFSSCSGLTSVAIPSSVTSIGWGAFHNCHGLTSVTIPEGVTSIGKLAFYGCSSGVYSGLTSVTIPSSVTSIGECAFIWCSGLMSFVVDKDNTNYKSEKELLLTKDGATLVAGVNGDVTIPNSVTHVGDHAFDGCRSLTSVTIPNSVTHIGDYAFNGCRSLTSVTIPNSVTKIENHAFDSCRGLTNITIPDSVTSIEEYAFWRCYGLTSVTIPSSVTSIGEYAFSGCEELKTVYVEKGDAARVKGLYDWDSGVKFVESEMPTPEPEGGFDGSVSHTLNGLVYDADGVMCGMAQITTAKETKKGVKVGGFVMLADGKKQTVKAATVPIENGQLDVTTKVGKTELTLTITGDGFTGTLGDMTLASADVDEDTGILSGTLKMSYFDAKTGKIKTKSIPIGGVASGGEAVGTATVKGRGAKSFAAEVE